MTKNRHAVILGRRGGKKGGSKGGTARARNLTSAQLTAIGKKGAAVRWCANRNKPAKG